MNKLLTAILLSFPIISESSEYADFIKNWEGYESRVYTDSQGNKTIGWGFNLSDVSSETKLNAYGLSRSLLLVGQPISNLVADKLLYQEVACATVIAKETFPSFDTHSKGVKKILVDLCYNLGPNKIVKFVKFKAAIESKDYKGAANELVDSKWYNQVGRRSEHHVRLLRILSAS